MSEEEDLTVELRDENGNLLTTLDFAAFRADVAEYANRFGLTMREAVESIANVFNLNMEIDPAATVETILCGNPWLFRFPFDDGSAVEVDLSAYAEEIKQHAKEQECTVNQAAKVTMIAHAAELRPHFRWIDAPR